MPDPVPSYTPSGRVSWERLVLVGPAGAVTCGALGFAYQLGQQGMPLLWFACLYTLAAALLVAMLAGLLVRAGQVRGRGPAMILGALWGLSAVGGSFLAAHQTTIASVLSAGLPRTPTFLEDLDARIDAGWVIGRGRELSGVFVLAVWLVEAALLTFAGVRGASPSVYAPFCEDCGRFATPLFAIAHAVDASALRVASVRGRLDTVLAIPRSTVGSRLALYEVRTCPSCSRGWLDVRLESASAHIPIDDGATPLPMLWIGDLLGACGASLAALGRSATARAMDRPIRAVELDEAQVEALRARPRAVEGRRFGSDRPASPSPRAAAGDDDRPPPPP